MCSHQSKLENMYINAPINKLLPGDITIVKGLSTIRMKTSKQLFHMGEGVHGALYFKLLDDACFFASNSLAEDLIYLTASFEVQLFAPITVEDILATGIVRSVDGNKIMAEATLVNSEGKTVAKGSGLFVRSKNSFSSFAHYK